MEVVARDLCSACGNDGRSAGGLADQPKAGKK